MPEQVKNYTKTWSELSSQTKEVCELIGTAPTGLNNFELMVGEEESKAVLIELKERGLLIERTYREELEEKAGMISDERRKDMVSLRGPVPSLTKDERVALEAIGSLKEQSEKSLNSMRIQLDRNFGEFVEGLDIVKISKNEIVSIRPDETKTIITRPGGEPEEVQKVLSIIEQDNKLQLEYEPMEQKDLEKEYIRIYSDFELSMKYEDRLRAILGVLVEKYKIKDEDMARLRK